MSASHFKQESINDGICLSDRQEVSRITRGTCISREAEDGKDNL